MSHKTRRARSFWTWPLTFLGGLVSQSGLAADPSPSQTLYPSGSQSAFTGPEANFTGEVRVRMLFPANQTAAYSGATVTFQPGARTAWHLHPGGQHMIVTDGVALTGTRDGQVLAFSEGETVWCPADLDHWHGATPEAAMTHLVITGSRDGEAVIWKEKVSDADYARGRQRAPRAELHLGALSARQAAMIPIAALTAKGDLDALKTAIRAGFKAGLTINEIKEIPIHLSAYAGFPRALNGLATLMMVIDERQAAGLQDPLGQAASPWPEDGHRLELGQAVQTKLVGRPVTGPLFDFAPEINHLLQSHLFGDLFARGILDEQAREIVTIAALASLDGVDSQLKAHLAMAANAGLTQAQIDELLAVLARRVGENPES